VKGFRSSFPIRASNQPLSYPPRRAMEWTVYNSNYLVEFVLTEERLPFVSRHSNHQSSRSECGVRLFPDEGPYVVRQHRQAVNVRTESGPISWHSGEFNVHQHTSRDLFEALDQSAVVLFGRQWARDGRLVATDGRQRRLHSTGAVDGVGELTDVDKRVGSNRPRTEG